MAKIAVIAGTGAQKAENSIRIKTSYGNVDLGIARLGKKQVFVINRHQHLMTPSLVNYRAIALALRKENVDVVISTSATGRISKDVLPGHLGCVSNLYNHNVDTRPLSFMQEGLIVHVGEPFFTPALQDIIRNAWTVVKSEVEQVYNGTGLHIGFHLETKYVCIEGPQFLSKIQEDVLRENLARAGYPVQVFVGMTAREALTLKEAGLDYCLIPICTDYSSSPPKNEKTVAHCSVKNAMRLAGQAGYLLLEEAVRSIPDAYQRQARMTVLEEDFDPAMLRKTGHEDVIKYIEQDRADTQST